MKEEESAKCSQTYGSLVPDSGRYAPPEISRAGWESIKRGPVYAVDAYNFGTLIFEVFNGSFLGGDQIAQTKNVPPSMHQSYKRLLSQNPKARLSVGQFLEQGTREGGFFQTPLIQITEDIDSLGLKSEGEREEFLRSVRTVNDRVASLIYLPPIVSLMKLRTTFPKIFSR